MADLAFYAYRDMETCDWRPFVKAAVERSPVSLEMARSKDVDEVYAWLGQMDGGSLYDANRLAQPDEVANYHTVDGLEKAFLLANILRNRQPDQTVRLKVDGLDVLLRGADEYRFTSAKTLQAEVDIDPDGAITVDSRSAG